MAFIHAIGAGEQRLARLRPALRRPGHGAGGAALLCTTPPFSYYLFDFLRALVAEMVW